MSLSTFHYFAWLVAATGIFYWLPVGRPRRILLLVASYAFYLRLSHGSIAVLLAITAISFFGGLALRSQTAQSRLPTLFAWLLGVVLTPLLVFKYADFIFNAGSNFLGIPYYPLTMALPIGVSFFTFAAVGYLIDVYLEVLEPEARPLSFALFLAFFPLVTAGPIERGQFMSQFDMRARFSAAETLEALRLLFWGLVLKIVFADYLEQPLPEFFDHPANFRSLDHLFAMIHYVFALYADFAGYSLIAIGSARMFGLRVRPNFIQPLLSASIPEFWRKWHVSLSSWVRDYLFSPLRMHWRSHAWGMYGALMVSFVVLGLWHGAGWGFLAFGLMHGAMTSLSMMTMERRNAFWTKCKVPPRLLHVVRVIITFLLVLLTFVVFRAPSLQDAGIIYKHLFSPHLFKDIGWAIKTLRTGVDYLPNLRFSRCYYRGWILVAMLLAGDILVANKWPLTRFPKAVQFIVYNIGVALILYKWIEGSVGVPFQYYKF